MEWHKRITAYQVPCLKTLARGGESESAMLRRLASDQLDMVVVHWTEDGKPYYKLWPTIAEGLSRVRLDIPVRSIMPLIFKMPNSISIRLPVGHEIESAGLRIREVFGAKLLGESDGRVVPAVAVKVNCGDVTEDGIPFDRYVIFNLKDGLLEDAVNDVEHNDLPSLELPVCELAVRIYIGLAMIHDNPDMVEAVVLRKDQAKYQATRDPKYVEKAKRRGEYGFNVGANIEVLPHFRRPHFAIRWTGKGSETPKLVPVKGCVVKRSKFTEVPTGYQADEEMALAGGRADG